MVVAVMSSNYLAAVGEVEGLETPERPNCREAGVRDAPAAAEVEARQGRQAPQGPQVADAAVPHA